jgi:hypothetical protein
MYVSLETLVYSGKGLQHELCHNLQQLYNLNVLFRIKKIVSTSSKDLSTLIKCVKIPGNGKGLGLCRIIQCVVNNW